MWKRLTIALVLVGNALAFADNTGRQVVIVCNTNEPQSRVLAEYYAGKRGVPTNQICNIGIRVAETITRKEFDAQVREPILRFLTREGLLTQEARRIPDPTLGSVPAVVTTSCQFRYLVLMYGVPLRIGSDPSLSEPCPTNTPKEFLRDEASVDSELAALPMPLVQLRGVLKNPFYLSEKPFAPPLDQAMILVGRLDGPKPEDVRRMVDDALTAERIGLLGRAYFDARGIRQGSYAAGDKWIRAAYEAVRKAGYDCELDDREALFGKDYPMSDVAVYAGWYAGNVTGAFARPGFTFQPGAVAYHIHSSSAATLHSAAAYWAGPLIARGAAVTMGCVYEPYLGLSPFVDVFFDRLLAGWTFLEAAWASEPVLSWQTTFVGDPLYRPFAATVEDQILRLKGKPEIAWAYARKLNRMAANGQVTDALALCRALLKDEKSPVLQEKLGDLLVLEKDFAAAVEAYRQASDDQADARRDVRVSVKLAAVYGMENEPVQALAVYKGLVAAYPGNEYVAELLKNAEGQPKKP